MSVPASTVSASLAVCLADPCLARESLPVRIAPPALPTPMLTPARGLLPNPQAEQASPICVQVLDWIFFDSVFSSQGSVSFGAKKSKGAEEQGNRG